MRIRYNTRQQELGQFFTPPAVAQLLAGLLPRGGSNLLELGAGSGALLKAASDRLGEVRITAVENDRHLFKALQGGQFADELIGKDACSPTVHRHLLEQGPYDYVIGNPPYTIAQKPGPSLGFAKEFGLFIPNQGARLDTLFLAHSISLMSETSAAAFIVPLTLFSDPTYALFRENLTKRFSNVTVIELPRRIFDAAEVATAICSFHGSEGKRKRIRVGYANMQGEVEQIMSIGVQAARQRLDFTYYAEKAKLRELVGKEERTLASIGAQIARGSASSTQLQSAVNDYLHTTHLPANGIGRLSYTRKANARYQLATSGDIVIPRVGSRCLMRQALIVKGEVPITDCIYRIRVAPQYRDAVLKSLAGPIGESWRTLYARGACAKHITAGDLMSMPVI